MYLTQVYLNDLYNSSYTHVIQSNDLFDVIYAMGELRKQFFAQNRELNKELRKVKLLFDEYLTTEFEFYDLNSELVKCKIEVLKPHGYDIPNCKLTPDVEYSANN